MMSVPGVRVQEHDSAIPGETAAGAAGAEDAGSADVLDRADRLIAALESHPDPAVGDTVHALLRCIDTVHRTALTHLVTAIHGLAGEAFLNRITADPAIRLLLMSYDLLAIDRRILAEEALDLVRGHLHAHGIDVELLELVGGAVYVRLHGVEPDSQTAAAARRDVEQALRTGLLGFQELVLREPEPRSGAPLAQLGRRRAHRPVYHDALAASELAPGDMRGIEIGGEPVLVANIGGTFHAVRNRCGTSPLPLEFGTLEGAELRCSWHGCRYDIRSGRRVDISDPAPDERLTVLPVAVANGTVRIAVGVEPVTPA